MMKAKDLFQSGSKYIIKKNPVVVGGGGGATGR